MVKIALVGPGLVGSEVISQIANAGLRRGAPKFSVIGIINSKRMVLNLNSINLSSWQSDLSNSADAADLDKFIQIISQPSNGHVVVVDCTSSDFVAKKYPAWLELGLHLVTPNKKGFSGDIGLFKKLKELSSSGTRRPLVYHESTVGAGLPIISTLNDLVRTGDEIVKIEGIFSGTLSYLFNNFSSASIASPQKFSNIVTVAKDSGYTEPDPRDDLNGMDVARKVVILGRVAGVDLSTETLEIENIVPEQLRSEPSADVFMTKLPQFDDHFQKLNLDARKNGKVLRYVGLVDVQNPTNSSVKLSEYNESHPFATLKGSDNIISFITKRFPNGLIIRGAGAGASVTAFGIFSDILKIEDITSYSS
ncbi:hypothetical protein HK096_010972 [Nowakowskiella sp. JEL0078]|nr:hypothetical protein HK096_010972 [Nowakowskiella sp. JEL0078]